MAGRGGPHVVDRVEDEPHDVDLAVGQWTSGIKPGQQQQVLHQSAHPGGLRGDPFQGMHDVCGQRRSGPVGRGTGPLGQLGMAADHRDRRAEFVAGVGDESAQAVLAVGPGDERRLDLYEHRVERTGQGVDLAALRPGRHPVRQ